MRRICSLFFLLPLLAFAQAKLVVCVTAQNDEETILRCLKSVEKFADYIYLADLGSTDETLQLAAAFFDEGAVEGTIEKTERSLFASNREQTLENAKKTAGKLGYSLRQTYFLFLDAAMIAQFNDGWKKKDLVKNDGYRIYQKWPHLGHSRLCLSLIRGSLSWKQKGVLQDDWSAEAFQAEKLDTLAIENLAEPKPERLQREVKQCKEVLATDPQNGTALLQLGFAYRSLKQFGDAAEAFNQRIHAGGDPEERWFSKYMIGRCQEEAGEWADALYWYLEAFEENTARGEPLLRISRHYRVRGENDLSYLFAKHGTLTHTEEYGSLFDEIPYNSYQLHEDLSIAAFYTQFKDDGFASADRVLLNPNTPWYVKDHTYRNILFYTQNLPHASYIPIAPELPPIEAGADERYRPMNPSIAKTPGGYKLICRSVNYTQTGAKIFSTNDSRGIYRTRNFLIDYDTQLNPLSQNEIIEDLSRERIISCSLEGLEDCRLVECQGSLWFTCTTADTNPTGNRQISLCKLENSPYGGLLFVDSLTPLFGPDLNRCEKNWLPFVQNDRIHIVYSSDPFTVMQPDPETGECPTVLETKPPIDGSRFRGSAAPIPFDDGYLMLVHETVQHYDHTRCYLHRFVYLNSAFEIQKLSKPFTFRHQGIEFCCSMTLDHAGRNLILPIGIEDREAYLCLIGADAVRSLLEPLPSL